LRLSIADAAALGFCEKEPVKKRAIPQHNFRPVPNAAINKTKVANGVIYELCGAWLKVDDLSVILRLPYPISANQLWRSNNDTNILSKAAKQYRKRVHAMYLPLLQAIGWKPINIPMEARLLIQPPTRQKDYSINTYPRYDVDNYSKPILDCLKSSTAGDVLFRDDRLFVREQIRFAQPVDDGCVWVSCIYLKDDWLQKKVDLDWLSGVDTKTEGLSVCR
jgi:crossover junction endodeoxyribonuclease RusA